MRCLVLTAVIAVVAAVADALPAVAAPAALNVCKVVPSSLVKSAAGGKTPHIVTTSNYSVKPKTTAACHWTFTGGTVSATIIRFSGGNPKRTIRGLCATRRAVPNLGDRACFFLSVTPGGKQTMLYALKGTAIVASSANVLGRSKRVASQAQLTAIANVLISAV